MIAALMVATLVGSFALARFYGMLPALGVLGVSWAAFAWLPALAVTVPVAFLVVAALLMLGWRRGRQERRPSRFLQTPAMQALLRVREPETGTRG